MIKTIIGIFTVDEETKRLAEAARQERQVKQAQQIEDRRITEAKANIPDPRKLLFGMCMQRVLANPMDVRFERGERGRTVNTPHRTYKLLRNRVFKYADNKVCVLVEYNRYRFDGDNYREYPNLHIEQVYVRDGEGKNLSIGEQEEWIEPLIETLEKSYEHQEKIKANQKLAEEKLKAIDQMEAFMVVEEGDYSLDKLGLIEHVKDEQNEADLALIETASKEILSPLTKG